MPARLTILPPRWAVIGSPRRYADRWTKRDGSAVALIHQNRHDERILNNPGIARFSVVLPRFGESADVANLTTYSDERVTSPASF